MSDTFGMPGPGGSLGLCALCGGTFIAEILLGQQVKSFTIPASPTELYAHDKCLKEFDGKDIKDLPDKSPLKEAFLKQKQNGKETV